MRQSSPQETIYSLVREQSNKVESGIKGDRTKTVSAQTVLFDGTYDDDEALVRFSPGVPGLGDDTPGGDISHKHCRFILAVTGDRRRRDICDRSTYAVIRDEAAGPFLPLHAAGVEELLVGDL